MKPSKYWFIVVCVLTAAGCSKKEPEQTPVARLDNKTLSLEEIRARMDSVHEPSQAQIQQYIHRWIMEESLYREAVDRGLDRTDDLNQKLDDVRRQLAINALLEKEVYSRQPSDCSSEDIRRYYEAHIKEFNLLHDVALVSYVLFKNRDAATEFRNLVLKGTSWSSAVDRQAATITMRVDSSYQSQASLMPQELWRIASNAVNKELSYPINTTDGYYILVVWKFMKQGQTQDLTFVEEEIRGRLTVEKRRSSFDQFIQTLRAKHAIDVFVNDAPDTAKSKMKE